MGEQSVWDARLVRGVAVLPNKAAAAALTAADRELWYYSASTGRAHYQNIDDLIGGKVLGVRELPPEPVNKYTLSKLVADPVRPRVYGLDAIRGLVVAIDTSTASAVGAIIAGSGPSDIDVDASGAGLYIGHQSMMALGRIDLASWKFDRFIPVPLDSYDVAALGNTHVAFIDRDQWTRPTLVDISTNTVVASTFGSYQGALANSTDGKTLFVGESSNSISEVTRYDVSSGKLTQIARSNQRFQYPMRQIASAPDGAAVFYAGYAIEGTLLTSLLYPLADPILGVTPDGRLAISGKNVYQAVDGKLLGALTVTGGTQAISPDSKRLYVTTGNSLAAVDLTAY